MKSKDFEIVYQDRANKKLKFVIVSTELSEELKQKLTMTSHKVIR